MGAVHSFAARCSVLRPTSFTFGWDQGWDIVSPSSGLLNCCESLAFCSDGGGKGKKRGPEGGREDTSRKFSPRLSSVFVRSAAAAAVLRSAALSLSLSRSLCPKTAAKNVTAILITMEDSPLPLSLIRPTLVGR